MGALNLRKESTGGFIAGKKERVEEGMGGTGRGGDEEREKKGKKRKEKGGDDLTNRRKRSECWFDKITVYTR